MEWPCSIPDEAKGAWAQLALLGLEGVGVESLQQLRGLGCKARTAVFNPAFTRPLARSIDAGVEYLKSLGWLERTENENTISLVHSVAWGAFGIARQRLQPAPFVLHLTARFKRFLCTVPGVEINPLPARTPLADSSRTRKAPIEALLFSPFKIKKTRDPRIN